MAHVLTEEYNKGFYSTHIGPRVVHTLCAAAPIQSQRQRVIPRATGRVLEIGIGSGLNLPHYRSEQVEEIVGVDPDGSMLRLGQKRRDACSIPLNLISQSAETLPLDGQSIDTLVLTYTLCSIPNPLQALAEARRVLKPDGIVLMCEHGAAGSKSTARWQNRVDRTWSRIALGCHLNRNPADLLRQSGFEFETLEQFVLKPFPSLVGTHYLGTARLAGEQFTRQT